MTRRLGTIATFVIVALYPIPAPAQTPSESTALAAWNDSLRAAATPAAVERLAPRAGDGDGVEGLRKALLALRRGEVRRDRGQFDQALMVADWVGNAHHDAWAWPHYIVARAAMAMDTAGWFPIEDDGIEQGETFEQAFWRSVRQTLHIDPDFPGLQRWILPTLVAGGDRLLRSDQLAVVQRVVSRRDPDPDALLVWGRYLRAERDYLDALTTFNMALARGGDTMRLDLERARTLRALHDSIGAGWAYWDGLRHITPVGRRFYRFDLAWIVSADSLKAFDRVPDDSLAWWLHRFWDERDVAAVQPVGSRLSEQLRRWGVAYARYRVKSPWRHLMYDSPDIFIDNAPCVHRDSRFYDEAWALRPSLPGDIRSREWLLDQRGIIYLRHGEPIAQFGGIEPPLNREDFADGPDYDAPDTSRVWSHWARGAKVATFMADTGMGGVPFGELMGHTESWLYIIGNDQRVLNFRGSAAIGSYDATTLASYLPYSPASWLLLSGTLQVYHAAAVRIVHELLNPHVGAVPDPPTCWNPVRTAIARSRVDADSAIHNDTDSPPVLHPWAFNIRMFALGQARDSSGQALIVMAFGGDSLRGQTTPSGTIYPIHLVIEAWNHQTGEMVRVDTVRVAASRTSLTADSRLVMTQSLPLSAGDWEVGLTADQGNPQVGAYTLRRDVRVDSGVAPALSDIVTGVTGAPSWLATDGAAFPINVFDRWPSGSSIETYYEVRGLPAGTPYQTTVEVEPIGNGKGPTLRIATSDRSTAEIDYIRRSVGTERLLPGEYRLTVTVRAGQRHATRSTTFVLLAPAPH
jgi:hypothetical protein